MLCPRVGRGVFRLCIGSKVIRVLLTRSWLPIPGFGRHGGFLFTPVEESSTQAAILHIPRPTVVGYPPKLKKIIETGLIVHLRVEGILR